MSVNTNSPSDFQVSDVVSTDQQQPLLRSRSRSRRSSPRQEQPPQQPQQPQQQQPQQHDASPVVAMEVGEITVDIVGSSAAPAGTSKKPVVIPPPTLRPQHVYAPVAPMGMLTLGLFSKKKDHAKERENLMHGAKDTCVAKGYSLRFSIKSGPFRCSPKIEAINPRLEQFAGPQP